MKTFIITLSRVFPKGHKKEGEPTFFEERFVSGLQCQFCSPENWVPQWDSIYPKCTMCLKHNKPEKIHTIRANYDLWAKRFEEIERGEACLAVRKWTGKPYRSPQIEIARLTKSTVLVSKS